MDHSTASHGFHLLAINPQSTVFLAVLLLILLLLSFIASGAEVALFSLLPKDVNMLKTKQHAAARRITTLLDERKAVYTSLLMAGTIFDISIIILGNYLLTPVLQLGTVHIIVPINIDLLVKILVMAFVIVLLGKILPKVWATQNNLRFAYSTSAVVEGIHLLLRRISLRMVDIAENISQVSGANQQQTRSVRELDEAIDVNTVETTDEEKNILKGIVKFGNINVRQIMRFRLDVNGIEYSTSFPELLGKVEELHYSRLPIYRGSMDDIVGVINTKDLVPHMENTSFDWHSLIRPTFFVPESKLIKDLLQEFQHKRIHFAIVVDEFGGTSGIVTMEDILEEIIGDIHDEFDEEESGIQKITDNSYIIDGKMMLYDMCRHLGLSLDTFDKVKGESDSVGGLVLEIAGEFPQANEVLTAGDFQFKVLNVERNRIGSVQVTIAQREEA
ncbi:gliding motility-associated protein GldE [Cnuella takakiae]|uniref:Gliding motility-associated protein GldE n=1 Tax=Cnuella takakiae TaxID=1302690 RepID=A0A1M5D4G7_9BACT|nr:gliding motility-associated protein GldE [Cnuella takakiae]SHF61876.1 gliding motility-associated protein GldE [Cnuella takakiae]